MYACHFFPKKLGKEHFPNMAIYTIVVEMEDGSILGDNLRWTNFQDGGRVLWLQPEKHTPEVFRRYGVMIDVGISNHIWSDKGDLTRLHPKPGFIPHQHLPVIAFMHLRTDEKVVARDFHEWNLTIPRDHDAYKNHVFITIPGSSVAFASKYAAESLPEVSLGALLNPLYRRYH